MGDGPKIVLGEEDFAEEAPLVPTRARTPVGTPLGQQSLLPPPLSQQIPQTGSQLPPVTRSEPRQVRPAGPSAPYGPPGTRVINPLTDPRIAPVIAGVASVALGWLLCEVFGVVDLMANASSPAGMAALSGVWVGCIGLVFGCVMLTYDRLFAGAWEAAGRRIAGAALPMFAISFAAGFLAQLLYWQMLKDASFDAAFGFQGYLARILGWGIFGLGVGMAVGALSGSSKRAVNGAIGGAIGGAVGGLLFQFFGLKLGSSDVMARLIGLVSVAALVAIAVRFVEQTRREAWLSVVSGGMSGKEFILYHPQTRIGASPECEIFLLKDPAVAKQHAWIEDRGVERTLHVVEGNVALVDGAPIATQRLRSGNHIQIGNTVILYSERAQVPSPYPTA